MGGFGAPDRILAEHADCSVPIEWDLCRPGRRRPLSADTHAEPEPEATARTTRWLLLQSASPTTDASMASMRHHATRVVAVARPARGEGEQSARLPPVVPPVPAYAATRPGRLRTVDPALGHSRPRFRWDDVFGMDRHMKRILDEFSCRYFNTMRPHQWLGQRIPASTPQRMYADASNVVAMPVLGGLHHEYQMAA